MPHFLGNQFARAAGVALTHLPYRGAAPGLQDLMGGQVASGCFSVGDCLPHLPSGRVRVLGVTDARRSRFLPEVPTFEEQGVTFTWVLTARAWRTAELDTRRPGPLLPGRAWGAEIS